METENKLLTPEQLSKVNDSTRKMISDFLIKNEMSLNSFSKQSNCHQNQLWLYLNSGLTNKGLHSSTMEKIGLFIYKYNLNR